ncbi:MAG: hypothetical protein WDM70_05760 [Nitrosomonadales bacterium]
MLAGLPYTVPGLTVNRFCLFRLAGGGAGGGPYPLGEAEVMIAAGTESMSLVPMMGNKIAFNPEVFAHDENIGIAYGMGLTAEKVAERWKISREAQDEFAFNSHGRAVQAIASGEFRDENYPV